MEEEGLAAAAERISIAGGEDSAGSSGNGDGRKSGSSGGPRQESAAAASGAAAAAGGGEREQGASRKGSEKPPVEASRQSANRLSLSDFVMGEELGQGSYSSVRRATKKTSGNVVAIKVREGSIDPSNGIASRGESEASPSALPPIGPRCDPREVETRASRFLGAAACRTSDRGGGMVRGGPPEARCWLIVPSMNDGRSWRRPLSSRRRRRSTW